MKQYFLLLGLLLFIKRSYNHYVFSGLIVNGTVTPEWKYVRMVAAEGPASSPSVSYLRMSPMQDVTSRDLICGRNVTNGINTDVATVLAGSEVGFMAKTILGEYQQSIQIVHEGPGQVYLSRAPNDDVQHYDGSGDWFKIAYAGPSSNTTWQLFEKAEYRFNIPKTTPPGKYLLRMEHIYPWPTKGSTQFYVGCAQVNIVGPGGGKPTDFIKFPSGYSATDPGILIPSLQFQNKDLVNYKPPGPAVWQG